MGYNLNISALAHEDIDEIIAYIMHELQNKSAAIRFLDELDAAYENLAQNPFMYEQSRMSYSFQFEPLPWRDAECQRA